MVHGRVGRDGEDHASAPLPAAPGWREPAATACPRRHSAVKSGRPGADAESKVSHAWEGSAITSIHRFTAVLAALSLLFVAGCVGGAWKQARRQDTIASYHRFLRDHPDSKYAAEARERFEFHKLKRQPTLEGLEAFAEQHPNSPLLVELRPVFEERAFAAARAAGTPAAYDRFLEKFGDGALASRAAGNKAFLEADGFEGRPAELAAFSEEFPDSDFAAEARRSIASIGERKRTSFRTVGLVVEIAGGTPTADRLRRTFQERAVQAYSAAGMRLVAVPSLRNEGPAADAASGLPRARLVIQHEEAAVRSKVAGGQMSRPGTVATTVVTLREDDEAPPVWSRTFRFRVDAHSSSDAHSIVFGPTGKRFWDEFFVPVATWQSTASVRPALTLAKPLVAIDTAGSRAVVLFEDGNFQLLDLSDPLQPVVLAEYERPKDLKKWGGVRLLGNAAFLFGEDGFEVVHFTPDGARRVASSTRDEVGSVVGVELVGSEVVVAGNRGLFLTDLHGADPARLLGRPAIAMTRVGSALVFTDGEAFMISSVSLLRKKRVLAQLRLGKGFGPYAMRSFGTNVAVLGDTGVITLDLASPKQPRVVSRLRSEDVGRVEDVSVAAGRLFLLGERGVQVVDPSGRRALESVDVAPRARMRGMGRHLVAIGGKELQVVDATPLVAAPGAAAPR